MRKWGKCKFHWNSLHFIFWIVYCVWMCAEEGGRLDTIIILVSKSSGSCQNSGEEKPWELGGGRAPRLYRLFTPVISQFGPMNFFLFLLATVPQLSPTQNLPTLPHNLAVLSVLINFLKITLSSPNLLGQLFSAWLAGSLLGIALGCWASRVSKLKWLVGVTYLLRFAVNFLGFSKPRKAISSVLGELGYLVTL